MLHLTCSHFSSTDLLNFTPSFLPSSQIPTSHHLAPLQFHPSTPVSPPSMSHQVRSQSKNLAPPPLTLSPHSIAIPFTFPFLPFVLSYAHLFIFSPSIIFNPSKPSPSSVSVSQLNSTLLHCPSHYITMSCCSICYICYSFIHLLHLLLLPSFTCMVRGRLGC